MAIPDQQSITFVAEDTIDAGCYWHGTIEELREDPGQQGKVCL